ncbi:DUF2569 family protein [Reyranella sp.]|uniref:DUF2569 family protein n=1 Tax=Reyranella sp. TaxID=1929291 RepID=UPI003BAC1AD0
MVAYGLAALLVVGLPVWLVIRLRRRAAVAGEPLRGFGGWLALFAFLLCLGFVRYVAELVLAAPDVLAALDNAAARGPFAVVGLVSLATMALYLWAIVTLFQRKRFFRKVYAALWALSFVAPFCLLVLLAVPGVRVDSLFGDGDLVQWIAGSIGMGLWYWYLCVSTRVRNTLVN